MAFDWNRGYTCVWRFFHVDARTFADDSLVSGVDSAQVEATSDGLLQSATVTLTRPPGEVLPAGYYRLVLTAEQDGSVEREEVATLWCASTAVDGNRGADSVTVEGRGVLWPASRTRLLAGTYAPEGADGARYAADLLGRCLAAPVMVEGGFEIGAPIVFDLGATCLDAARQVLDAGGFAVRADGHGRVTVGPSPAVPAADLTGASLMPGVKHGLDTSEVHNRYTAVMGQTSVTAVNDDPASEVSTAVRGYADDEVDQSPEPLAGETLAAYAARRLAESSVVGETYGYTREYAPGVVPGDLVRLRLPAQAVDATARVVRQHLDCSHGIKVTEEARTEVALWTP